MFEKFDDRQTEELNHGRRGRLVIALRNLSTYEEIPLESDKRRWILGSDDSCDLRFSDRYVSGIHCQLERRGDGSLQLRDRSSRNGTFVDGSVIESAELRAGSYVSIGRTTLLAVGESGARGGRPPRAIELLRGTDPRTRATIEQAIKAAQTDCSVLVLGETGTGKEHVARLVHESSRRASGPFVAVNCGAMPANLIGTELFGHEKGAFTGAVESRDGYFVQAHGGTLFLDEIGELSLELQAHLLRALETRRVRRLGGTTERSVDVRIVAATNRVDGLGTDASKHMRADLYHRLATMVLMLVPLRERAGDIVDIVQSMLEDCAEQFGAKTVTPDGWQALMMHDWPGNVRELKAAVARAVTLGGTQLGPIDFFPDLPHMLARAGRSLPAMLTASPAAVRGSAGEGAGLPAYEAIVAGAMRGALAEKKTIRAAAEFLGMAKSTFADRARQYGIVTQRRRRGSR
jgi:transcriptional regulator with PAS, ATPase and Fis domain